MRPSTPISRRIVLLELRDGRYLANTADLGIYALVYSTWTWFPDLMTDGEPAVTVRVYFEVADLQPRSRVRLGPSDGEADTGVFFVQLERVLWNDGAEDGPMLLSRRDERGARAYALSAPIDAGPLHDGLAVADLEQRELHTEPVGLLWWS